MDELLKALSDEYAACCNANDYENQGQLNELINILKGNGNEYNSYAYAFELDT